MKHRRTHKRRHHSKRKTSRHHSRRHIRKGGRGPAATTASPSHSPRASLALETIREHYADFKNRYPIPKPAGHRKPTVDELSHLKQLRDEADYVSYDAGIVGNQQKKNTAKALGDEIEVYENSVYAEYR